MAPLVEEELENNFFFAKKKTIERLFMVKSNKILLVPVNF